MPDRSRDPRAFPGAGCDPTTVLLFTNASETAAMAASIEYRSQPSGQEHPLLQEKL